MVYRGINKLRLYFRYAVILLVVLAVVNLFYDITPDIELQYYLVFGFVLIFLSGLVGEPLGDQHQLEQNTLSESVQNNGPFWVSIASVRSTFKSEKLVKDRDDLVIKTTLHSTLFHLVFVVVGLFVLLIAFFLYISDVSIFAMIIPSIVGGGFFVFGLLGVRLKVLGRLSLNDGGYVDLREGGRKTFLAQVIAIQLLDCYKSDKNIHTASDMKHRYVGYEVNLVLKDLSRITVLSHGDKPSVILEAKAIAKYLNVKMWHNFDRD